MHDYGNQLHAVPLRRGRQAIQRRVGRPGFEAGGPLVEADELVGVGQLELPVPEGVHPDSGKLSDLRVIQNERPAHQGDVIGAGHMARGGQAGAVEKVGVLHAQFGSPLVHQGHEGLLAARHMLGQGHGAVVGGHHRYCFDHIPDGQLFILFQPDLGPAHGDGMGGSGDHVLPRQLPGVDGLHYQQQGHHLSDGGGFILGMSVLLIENGTRGLFH